MPKTVVRPSNPRDLPTLLEIDRQCFAEGIRYDWDELQYFATTAGARTLVVEFDHQIVAFGIVHHRSGRGHVITLDVLEEFRSRGIGSLLLECLHEAARQQGVSLMALEVSVANQSAIRFYERHGYRRSGLRRRYYADGSDALVMKKSLQASPDETRRGSGER